MFPDPEAVEALEDSLKAKLGARELEDRLLVEVNTLNSKRADYHPFDHVAHIQVVRHKGGRTDGLGKEGSGPPG